MEIRYSDRVADSNLDLPDPGTQRYARQLGIQLCREPTPTDVTWNYYHLL